MKKVYAWPLMYDVVPPYPYPYPSGEESYIAHAHLIDVVHPGHGGRLLADGSWQQDDWQLDTDFSRALPAMAAGYGHLYWPAISAVDPLDPTSLETVLDSPAIQQTAIDGLLTLATTRWDAPWDGIMWGAEHCSFHYRDKYDAFLTDVSAQVKQEGFLFGVAYRAILPTYFQAAISLNVMARITDIYQGYTYSWWENPWSTTPYWWNEQTVAHALTEGMTQQQFVLGLPIFSRYWPTPGDASSAVVIGYDNATGLVQGADGTISWVENHATGLIREKYGTVGAGHVWISEGNVIEQRLDLADEHGIEGVMLFALGMEHQESVWFAIEDWKYPWPRGEFRVKNPDNKDPRTRESRDRYAVWLDD